MNYQTQKRDCQAWKDDGLELSTTSNEAAKYLDHALDQMFCHVPDPAVGGVMGTINKMLKADENFVMAKIFSIGVQGGSCRNSKSITDTVKELQGVDGDLLNQREKLHRKAVVEWANEDKLDACRTWEQILFQYPRDTMALLFSYYGYIMSGQSRMLRDSLARVLPFWRESDFHYGYLQGYYAFGLEQTNMFDKAEVAVKKSLQRNRDNTWAMHAYSHIYDATCRSQEGVDFLEENDKYLAEENSLSCHIHWHQTVNLTELGHYQQVLGIYDSKIMPAFKKSVNPFNLNDGVQTLQRLEFENVDVGDRWEELYLVYKDIIGQNENLYDDLHLLTAVLRSKTSCAVADKTKFFDSFEDHVAKGVSTYCNIAKRLGVDFAKGITAYTEGNYAEASDLFIPIYKDIWELGGSNAQRDFFNQFVYNSCMRSSIQHHRVTARAILNERKLYRPNSMLIDRVMAKLDSDHA